MRIRVERASGWGSLSSYAPTPSAPPSNSLCADEFDSKSRRVVKGAAGGIRLHQMHSEMCADLRHGSQCSLNCRPRRSSPAVGIARTNMPICSGLPPVVDAHGGAPLVCRAGTPRCERVN